MTSPQEKAGGGKGQGGVMFTVGSSITGSGYSPISVRGETSTSTVPKQVTASLAW